MSGKRANGEGSIFPYRNGFAAYVWVTKPDGKRARKYVYGKTRDEVHDKWVRLHQQAKAGPVATNVPTVATYMKYWLTEIVEPNLAPLTYTTYETLSRLYIVPGIGAKRLDDAAVRARGTDLAQQGHEDVPVLRTGKGPTAATDEPEMLCGWPVLPGSSLGSHRQGNPRSRSRSLRL
nr:hypothetical protein [Salinispora arenicola]